MTRAMSAINDSGIQPGPEGIEETNPTADAPYLIANCASSTVLIQQILTRGIFVGSIVCVYMRI